MCVEGGGCRLLGVCGRIGSPVKRRPDGDGHRVLIRVSASTGTCPACGNDSEMTRKRLVGGTVPGGSG